MEVRGRVSALLELGSGFNPEFTGRENVFLNGTILGFGRALRSKRLYPAHRKFAEIGPFIHQPVKTYSSGMLVRLAFAVAINVEPEFLLVDEALAVGDIYFRQRCMRKIHELQRRGVTIVLFRTAPWSEKPLAARAWLDQGRLMDAASRIAVVAQVSAGDGQSRRNIASTLRSRKRSRVKPRAPVRAPQLVKAPANIDLRHGNGRCGDFGHCGVVEEGEELADLLPQQGSTIVLRISVRARKHIAMPVIGFLMRNHLGVELAGTNTALEEHDLPPFAPGDLYTVDFRLELPELYPAHFSFTAAVANGTIETYDICDWIDNAVTLQAEKGRPVYGFLHLPCQIRVNAVLKSPAAAGSLVADSSGVRE